MISVARYLPPVGLFMIAASLITTIGLEIIDWRAGTPTRSLIPHTAPPVRDEAVNTPFPTGQYETWLSQTLARPVFSPDRRPVEAGIQGLPRLTGIVVTDAQRIAIFASASGQHPIIVESGGRVGSYEVQKITDTEVTVIGPQGRTVIRPVFDGAAPQTAAPGFPSPRNQPIRAMAR